MNKQSIERALGENGKFLCVNQVAEILGVDRGTVRQILRGVPYQPFGKKKMYFIGDLAEVLYRRQI